MDDRRVRKILDKSARDPIRQFCSETLGVPCSALPEGRAPVQPPPAKKKKPARVRYSSRT